MIVQVRHDSLRVIRQLDHSLASGRMALAWIPKVPFRDAWAVAMHDFAWADADREPTWDEATKTPVTFQTIGPAARTLVYASGLGRLLGIDEHAASLASLHYAAFTSPSKKKEPAPGPQSSIREAVALLRHLDDVSLFVCLACPESESRPEWLTDDRVSLRPDGARHGLRWVARDTLALTPFPFIAPLTLAIPCRDLPRKPYESAEDLRAAWEAAIPTEHRVRIVSG